MPYGIAQANDVRRDFLLFRLRALAEIGPQALLVKIVHIKSAELRLKLAPSCYSVTILEALTITIMVTIISRK